VPTTHILAFLPSPSVSPLPPAGGGVSSYASPNYRFYGATNSYPTLVYASLPEGASEAGASQARVVVSAAAPDAPTRPMQAAACAAAAALSAAVVRSGTLQPGAGIGLAFPSVAVAPNGAAVVAAMFSGPSRTPDGRADAFPGVAAAFLSASDSGPAQVAPLARAAGPIAAPAAAAATGGAPGYFGELTAADVHPVTGAVYVAARRGGMARSGAAFAPTWVGLIPMA
jgi:DNA polymerase-3 subunit gamma/tau